MLPWRGCEKLYLDARTADVFFVFEIDDEESIRISAHKNILSINSPVFDAMFFGSLKQDGDIAISDSTPDAFKEFLQFFYLNTVTLTTENKLEIMNLSEQYMLHECKNACTELSKATLTMDNMCWGYELAIFFEQDDLVQFCEEKIRKNSEEMFQSNSFLSCGSNLLRRILLLDSLNCDETVVFDGCLAWATAACIEKGLSEINMQNLRRQLGDLLYEIRFGEMTTEQFFHRFKKYEDLFSTEEFKDIIGMIASKDYQPLKFNRNPRTKIAVNDEIIVCDRVDLLPSTVANKYQIYAFDYTVFRSNQLLLLTRFDCCELFNEENLRSIPARLTICEVSNDKEVFCVRQIALSPKHETVVELTQPIEIKPNIKYGIIFEIRNESCYNLLVHKPYVKINDEVIIMFYDHAMGNVPIKCQKYGIVTRLHFLKSGAE